MARKKSMVLVVQADTLLQIIMRRLRQTSMSNLILEEFYFETFIFFHPTKQRQTSNVTNAINSLNNNTVLSAEEKRRVLEEEAKTLEQFKVR